MTVDQRESQQNSKKASADKMKKDESTVPTIEKVDQKRVKASTKNEQKPGWFDELKQTAKVYRKLLNDKDEEVEEKEEALGYLDAEIQTSKFSYIPNVKLPKTKEENELSELLEAMKRNQDKTSITEICVQNIQVQAQHIIDDAISNSTNLLELLLQDIDIVPQECLKLASDPRVANLRHLDLSCNSIGFKGFCNLLQKKTSQLGQLEVLELYSCELEKDFDHRRKNYDHIQMTQLQTLNLSHNDLCEEDALTLVLDEEFGLIQEAIETLYLVNIGI